MNLILLRGGFPPVAVRPEDRKTYLDTLEHASMREDIQPFQISCTSDWMRLWGVLERVARGASGETEALTDGANGLRQAIEHRINLRFRDVEMRRGSHPS